VQFYAVRMLVELALSAKPVRQPKKSRPQKAKPKKGRADMPPGP
jgi:hypothetical protein